MMAADKKKRVEDERKEGSNYVLSEVEKIKIQQIIASSEQNTKDADEVLREIRQYTTWKMKKISKLL